jgi:predicted CXXCH cytochrome family protein
MRKINDLEGRTKKMRGLKIGYVFFAILGLLLTASAARAAATGILNTKHNLTATGPGTVKSSTADGAGGPEVCVFCHTPHGSDTTIEAPLWNRAVNTSGYSMYSSPSLDGTIDAQPTGVSVACLSCHDGTIAFDALRNLPGSGGFTDTPSKTLGTSAWTFVGGTGTGNKFMPSTAITNLSQDLRNDHPISIDFASAKSPSSTSGVNDHATGFKDPTGAGDVTNDHYFTNGIKIAKGKVQCNSCHDPHRSDNPTFLRIDNGGLGNQQSAVCLTCHNKDG